MKAILCTAYGPPDVLKMVDIEKPIPKNNEVLIRIVASTVTFGDCEIRNLTLPAWTRLPVRLIMGYRRPKRLIPGMEYAGIVEATGNRVTKVRSGDAVFGSTGMAMGGNAGYICRLEKTEIGKIPSNVTFEDATTIPVGGINALHFLRMANIQPSQKVLVIGAGGSIGTWGVLLAKYFGAEVTAVDHTNKLRMLRDIGADHVLDYTKEDFATNGMAYDVILDLVYKSSFEKCVHSLTKTGFYLMANTDPWRMMKGLWIEWTTNKKVKFALAADNEKDYHYLAYLISSGKIKPVIDRTYLLSEAIEAHRYVERGLKKGNVIIKVAESEN